MKWQTYDNIAAIVADELGEAKTDVWRSIKCMHTEEVAVFDFQTYYRENRIYFIGNGTGLTGFIIIDPDPTASDVGRHDRLTFMDLDTIQDITFAFNNDSALLHTYAGEDTLCGEDTIIY